MATWGRRPEGEGYKTPEIGGISDEFLLMKRLVGINRLGVDVFMARRRGTFGPEKNVLGFEYVGSIVAMHRKKEDRTVPD